MAWRGTARVRPRAPPFCRDNAPSACADGANGWPLVDELEFGGARRQLGLEVRRTDFVLESSSGIRRTESGGAENLRLQGLVRPLRRGELDARMPAVPGVPHRDALDRQAGQATTELDRCVGEETVPTLGDAVDRDRVVTVCDRVAGLPFYDSLRPLWGPRAAAPVVASPGVSARPDGREGAVRRMSRGSASANTLFCWRERPAARRLDGESCGSPYWSGTSVRTQMVTVQGRTSPVARHRLPPGLRVELACGAEAACAGRLDRRTGLRPTGADPVGEEPRVKTAQRRVSGTS